MKFFVAAFVVLAVVTITLAKDGKDNEEKFATRNTDKCYWSGTSPFCAGTCLPGETIVKVSSDGDGRQCVTGQKVFCCPATSQVTPVVALKPGCVWKGTSPFCAGTCDDGFKLEKLDDIGDGQPCWSGKKALCCPKK